MEIIIIVIGIILLNKYIINIIHRAENKLEKSLYVVMLAITDMFLVTYYFDRFNLATRLNMNENIDTQNWLNNISNVFANIVSASIGGIIAYGIASSEIKENNKQNMENNRIQNMPILKYDIKTEGKNKKINSENLIETKYEKTKNSVSYNLFINIKNIGMNNVKQMILELESDCFIKKREY